eukprot:GFYU01004151.1.p1 GENE.GFYU01004151.1~~GFYU01004151.1.p1  ORF type:complete len:487 (-),score=146.72 GFYU01004151.1:546-2006(-)
MFSFRLVTIVPYYNAIATLIFMSTVTMAYNPNDNVSDGITTPNVTANNIDAIVTDPPPPNQCSAQIYCNTCICGSGTRSLPECKRDSDDCGWNHDLGKCAYQAPDEQLAPGFINQASSCPPEDNKDASDWIIGVALAVASGFMTNFGTTIQKHSHTKNSLLPPEMRKAYVRQPLWWAGFGVFMISQFCALGSLSFTAQSIVSSLSSISVLLNVPNSYFFLHEKVVKRDILGACVICAGSVLLILYGPHTPQDGVDLTYLYGRFVSTPFLIYMCLIVPMVVTAMVAIPAIEKRLAGSRAGPDAEGTTSVSDRAWWERVLLFCYPFTAGALPAFSMLLGKATGELIRLSFQGDNMMIYPSTYVIFVLTIIVGLYGVHYLNLGMVKYEVRFLIPSVFALTVTCSSIQDVVFFDEFREVTEKQLVLFPMAVVLTILGVCLLSGQSKTDENEKYMLSPASHGLAGHQHPSSSNATALLNRAERDSIENIKL